MSNDVDMGIGPQLLAETLSPVFEIVPDYTVPGGGLSVHPFSFRCSL